MQKSLNGRTHCSLFYHNFLAISVFRSPQKFQTSLVQKGSGVYYVHTTILSLLALSLFIRKT